MAETFDERDDLLALRGANACTFCPRLFWLEYVAGEFAHNEHTVEGSHVHRRVDGAGGELEAPEEGDEPWQARSLWLSDSRLGLTGKLDLVEASDDAGLAADGGVAEVMPVDTKKGRPPEQGLWPADQVQLTLQAMLLRAKGYAVREIAGYYAASRRRVVEELTPAHVRQAWASVWRARRLSRRTLPPPPLIDSPKCKGCSLNAICMPDESAFLEAPEGEPRQVLVPRTDARAVYVATPGAYVRKSRHHLIISPPKSSGEPEKRVGMGKIAQLNLLGGVQMSTQAMHACLRKEIPVHLFSYGGWYYGRATSTRNRSVLTRIAQFEAYGTTRALELARTLVADKIHNQRVLLRRNAEREASGALLRKLKRARDRAAAVDDVGALLGHEGEAARAYWAAFSELLAAHDEAFRMGGRNRRPPEDPTNAMLSFGYALLVKDCHLAVEAAGLDPYLGVYHTPHHGRPALALDLMEPFRPLIVDSVVLQVIRRGELGPDDFVHAGQAVSIKRGPRKRFIAAYERRMDDEITHPVFGYRASYRRTLAIQARLIARALTGEVDALPSFRTR